MSKPFVFLLMGIVLCLILVITTGAQSGKTHVTDGRKVQAATWLHTLGERLEIKPKVVAVAVENGNNTGVADPTITPTPAVTPTATIVEEPPAVKGVYVTGWIAGSTTAFQNVVNFIDKTEVNAMVIDVKDDTGTLSFPVQVPFAQQIGANMTKFDPVKVLAILKQHHIYPIARIVVFKDPLAAKKRTDLAVQSTQGGLWRDNQGLCWVDPYNKKVWEYTVAVAKEAAKLGFKEIQFDYVRFTSDGLIRYCQYPGNDGRAKADVIKDFLKYAYQELNPLGVKVGADVFGLTCSAQDDLGIGQVMEKIVSGVDVVCPMVYPSHYRRGEYGLANPDLKPYETVYQSLSDAQKKLAAMNPPSKVILRPWLQDFSLGNAYGRPQLLAQIKAVRDAGLREWIFWNPTNVYDLSKYRLKGEVKDEPLPTPKLTPIPTSSPVPTVTRTPAGLPTATPPLPTISPVPTLTPVPSSSPM